MNPNKLKFRRIAAAEPDKVKEVPDVGLASLKWGELTKLAREKGVFKVGMSRAQVEAACGA